MMVTESVSSILTGTAVQALVRQVTPDPIADTASYALTQRLGEDRLLRLRRREHWQMLWKADPQSAEQRTQWLFEASSVFVHPSKHRWQIHVTEDRRRLMPDDEPDAMTGVILVTDLDTAPMESTRKALVALYPECADLMRLSGGTWWELTYPRSIGDEGLDLRLRNLAETRSRIQGLFAHPHYQCAEILLPHSDG